jgi:hypothetical protein
VKKTIVAISLILAALLPAAGLEFSGLLQADYYGLIDPTTFYSSERIRLTLAPELAWKSESGLVDLHLAGYFFFQPLGEPMWVEPGRLLREAYLGLHVGAFDLYLGQKLITWGMVDILSPLNVVNHTDATALSTDNTLEASLPDLLAQLCVYLGDSLSFEVVYKPFVQPGIYPIEEIHVQELFILPVLPKEQRFDIDASFINQEVPLFSQWANSVHAALHYTSYFIDLTAAYSFYVDPMLDFDLSGVDEVITDEGTYDLHTVTGTGLPAYNRIHNLGMGASFHLRNLLISADGALKFTRDWAGTRMEVKNSELFYTLQVERMFWNRVRAQVNFFHRYVFNADAVLQSDFSPVVQAYINATIDDYLLQTPASQMYFLAHIDTHFLRERLTMGATVIYGSSEEALYLIPRAAFKLNDYLTLSAGADIWMRDEKNITPGYLGMNEKKDNFYLRLQLSF